MARKGGKRAGGSKGGIRSTMNNPMRVMGKGRGSKGR